MKQLLLLTLVTLSATVNASEIMKSYDKPFELSQNDRGYSLKSDNFSMHFPHHQVSKPIRDLRPDQLAALLQSNAYYLKATELSDGTHTLDLQGRVNGGALGGAAVAGVLGCEGSKLVFSGLSIGCLYLAQAAVHVYAGPEKGAEFHEKIVNRFIPHIADIAENFIGPVGGVAGAGVGLVSTPL